MTFLGALNFLVLQWFGVRLARITDRQPFQVVELDGFTFVRTGAVEWRTVTVGWKVLRWVWPLTGWWSDYRWIARRP